MLKIFNKISKIITDILLCLALLSMLGHATVYANVVSYGMEMDVFHPVHTEKGMVSSVDRLATEIGVEVLKNGGNAVDAAIAVGYALAVTYPQAGNIGGGGFMLIRNSDGSATAIDFREVAPQRSHRDMFLDDKGKVDSQRSLTTHLAVGVPGTVAGFSLAAEKYGSRPLAELIEPAITLAREGFIVNDKLAHYLDLYGRQVLLAHPQSKAIFFRADGNPWQKGERLVQDNLATSLELIAKEGASAFYQGKIAEQIVNQMAEHGGLITKQDLANYKVIERQPIIGRYKGYQIMSMPAPSSGGIHIIQLLNILENFDLKQMGQNSAQSIHVMAEAMKYVYADRSEYLGDPAFVKVPVQALISKDYAKTIASRIDLTKTTASTEIKPGNLIPYESDQTTHYSVVDSQGNAVSVTYTLNTNFGSGIVADESGILLNNEMDDFSAKPGVANIYGLIGGEANAVAAHKRPLSSMSPTIVTQDDKVILVTGSPGGSRIITTVLQIILNTLEFEMNIAEASSAPRIHHQWFPDEIRVEHTLSVDTIRGLEQLGHKVVVKPAMGSTQSIMVGPNGLYGASDPRSSGSLTSGY